MGSMSSTIRGRVRMAPSQVSPTTQSYRAVCPSHLSRGRASLRKLRATRRKPSFAPLSLAAWRSSATQWVSAADFPIRVAVGEWRSLWDARARLTGVVYGTGVSSAHVTFPGKSEWEQMGEQEWVQRTGIQYHWNNQGWKSFDDFLAALKQSKRKSIRQERNKVAKQGVGVYRLTGAAITEEHWDAFYKFYTNTGPPTICPRCKSLRRGTSQPTADAQSGGQWTSIGVRRI